MADRGPDSLSRTIRRILREERPEDAAFRTPLHWGVVDGIDDRRHPKDVRKEDHFLTERRAGLAYAREELNGTHPFFRGEAARGDKTMTENPAA